MDAGWRCCRHHYRAGGTIAWIKVKSTGSAYSCFYHSKGDAAESLKKCIRGRETDTIRAKFDELVKSLLKRHPGESRGPDVVPTKVGNHLKDWIPVFTGDPGFRLSPA
jgi:hypothetical protein